MISKEPQNLRRRSLLQAGAAAGLATFAGLAAPTAATAGPGPAHRPVDQPSIDAVTGTLEPDLVALRRTIHDHPEVAGEERRTAALVADRLRAAGLSVTTGVGGHGVVALLRGAHRGGTVGYRADLDAVPAGGTVGGSVGAGHLCGHDLHTAIGVGVAEVLARLRSRLSGTYAFLFQPAEENLAGARAMIDDGVLRSTGVRELHALHCGPLPVGTIAVTPGYGMPGLDRGRVVLTGPGAATRAEALAADLLRLATVAPPTTLAAMEQLVVDLGTPDGPLARFVNIQHATPHEEADGSVTVRLSYRCWPEDRYREVRRSIGTVAGRYRGRAEFPDPPFPALVCPERDGARLERRLRREFGAGQVARMHAAPPFNGEDYALFGQRIPVTYSFVGVRSPGAPVTAAFPHHVNFDPDEGAISTGVRAMAGWLAERGRVAR
ncbi:M20 family metallopeptidase [Microlunatus sp. GCM10028923]|uniref:M20 metallopeptidase family protein n=1 Tax=Microlunatus sp. GCM10028923 TaxID=3273400 RepID=UPI00360B955B